MRGCVSLHDAAPRGMGGQDEGDVACVWQIPASGYRGGVAPLPVHAYQRPTKPAVQPWVRAPAAAHVGGGHALRGIVPMSAALRAPLWRNIGATY
jgi:hypothetical protein